MRVHLTDGTTLDVPILEDDTLDTLSHLAEWLHAARFRHLGDHVVNTAHILRVEAPQAPTVPTPPAPPAPPATRRLPVYAHTPASRAEWWDSVLARPWATGGYGYWPGPWGHRDLRWTTEWERITAAHPEGLDVVVSPKAVNVAALEAFVENLPEAWAHRMTYSFWQEPEDNHLDADAREGFRRQVAAAARVLDGSGIRVGVHLQEWSLNPKAPAWGGPDNLAGFLSDDVQHVGWSIYEHHLRDRTEEQVDRVWSFMEERAPGLTWDASACGVSVSVGADRYGQERQTRAAITEHLVDLLIPAGADGFGWFDFPAWAGTRDYGVADDPYLRPVLMDLADVEVPTA